MQLRVTDFEPAVAHSPVEIVECNERGHPDTRVRPGSAGLPDLCKTQLATR